MYIAAVKDLNEPMCMTSTEAKKNASAIFDFFKEKVEINWTAEDRRNVLVNNDVLSDDYESPIEPEIICK